MTRLHLPWTCPSQFCMTINNASATACSVCGRERMELTALERHWLQYAVDHMLDDSEPEDKTCATVLNGLLKRASVERDREAEREQFRDPKFNAYLDQAITENGEFTAWHQLTNTADAYYGYQAGRHDAECTNVVDVGFGPEQIKVVERIANLANTIMTLTRFNVLSGPASNIHAFAHEIGELTKFATAPDRSMPIPEGVRYNMHHDNFYNAKNEGMGEAFYLQWYARRAEFPEDVP